MPSSEHAKGEGDTGSRKEFESWVYATAADGMARTKQYRRAAQILTTIPSQYI